MHLVHITTNFDPRETLPSLTLKSGDFGNEDTSISVEIPSKIVPFKSLSYKICTVSLSCFQILPCLSCREPLFVSAGLPSL